MAGNNRLRLQGLVFMICVILLLLPLSGGMTHTEKKVLLTFDDGPDSRYTPDILDTLRQYEIKALFFVLGCRAQTEPALFQCLLADGHTIGNHTFDHTSIDTMTADELTMQIYRTDRVLTSLGYHETLYFRPPRGHYTKVNADTLKSLQKVNLLWDLCIEKAEETDAEKLTQRLISTINGRRELVLLLHDGNVDGNDRSPTVRALPLLINELIKQGYHFVDPASTEGQMLIKRHAGVSAR